MYIWDCRGEMPIGPKAQSSKGPNPEMYAQKSTEPKPPPGGWKKDPSIDRYNKAAADPKAQESGVIFFDKSKTQKENEEFFDYLKNSNKWRSGWSTQAELTYVQAKEKISKNPSARAWITHPNKPQHYVFIEKKKPDPYFYTLFAQDGEFYIYHTDMF